MKGILKDIQSGAFAKEWMKEAANGLPRFKALAKREEASYRGRRSAVARDDALDEEEPGDC